MKDQRNRSDWLFPVVAGLTGIGLFSFRFLSTLDGPLHVLHAFFLEQRLRGTVPGADGLFYDLSAIRPVAMDVLAVPLLHVLPAVLVHKVLAVAVVMLLCISCWRLVHRKHAGVSAVMVLLLPVFIGYLFILGFFNFMVGVAVAFFFFAWYREQKQWSLPSVVKGIVWVLVCLVVHRGSIFIATVLIVAHELGRWRWWSARARRKPLVVVLLLLALALVAVHAARFLFMARTEYAETRSPLHDLITFRELLLVDRNAEWPFRVAFGLLFIGALVLAIRARLGRARTARADGVGIAALLLLIASLVIRTHSADLHYFSERAQWLVLVLGVVWIASVGIPGRTALVIGIGAFILHASRLAFLEDHTAQHAEKHRSVMAVVPHLGAQRTVIPVFQEQDFLLAHQAAWPMMEHSGMFLSRRDKFWLAPGTPNADRVRKGIKRNRYHDPTWLLQEIDRDSTFHPALVVFGTDPDPRDSSWIAFSPLLKERFVRIWGNGYVSVHIPQ